MTQAQLDLLRRLAAQAQQADMDVGLGANVLIALLDEIERLRASVPHNVTVSPWRGDSREIDRR